MKRATRGYGARWRSRQTGIDVSTDKPRLDVELADMQGYVRVKLGGDLDYGTMADRPDALRELTDLRTPVVLDLNNVSFIDSAGLGFLIRLAHAQEARIRLENVPKLVARVLDLTGLREEFDFDS